MKICTLFFDLLDFFCSALFGVCFDAQCEVDRRQPKRVENTQQKINKT